MTDVTNYWREHSFDSTYICTILSVQFCPNIFINRPKNDKSSSAYKILHDVLFLKVIQILIFLCTNRMLEQ